jgi:hypothetical protein
MVGIHVVFDMSEPFGLAILKSDLGMHWRTAGKAGESQSDDVGRMIE